MIPRQCDILSSRGWEVLPRKRDALTRIIKIQSPVAMLDVYS